MSPPAMAPELRSRYDRLRAIVRRVPSAAVAFSGGVDSALVLKVAHDELGPRAVAVTGRSASFAPEEMADAVKVCGEIGARQVFIDTHEIDVKGYRQNGTERCFACKTELYVKIGELLGREGLAAILDGVNVDDAGAEDRPGVTAAEQRGVISPLREAGLTKAVVRELAAALGLSIADKPAMACLSSRIPFGEAITEEKLAAVAAAESALRELGFIGARVRHHGSIARIELPADRLRDALEPAVRAAIVGGVRAAGFAYVTLDLEGYRTGSMHEVLQIRPAARSARPLALLLAAALLAGAGCMQTTVKPAQRRVLTAEEAAARTLERKQDESAKEGDAALPPPPPAATPEEEIERLRVASEREPQNPRWHFGLGRAYERQGKLELAELRYRRGGDLITPKGQYTGPHFFLGRALAKQEKWNEALSELTKAIAVKPPDIEGYYLNPDYREAFYLIGVIEHRKQSTNAAESAFRQFLKYGGERDRVVPFFPKMIAE